jgi:glutathione S-transferase
MTETDLILHHYDASPFTQKTLRMLGIKEALWYSVEMPMILPKPDLIALTGGYRGTPVLQIGADIYVDNQRIAMELESRIPEPTLFPDGSTGLYSALVKWSDAFFRAGLQMVIALQSKQWPEEFEADRRALFPDIDFDTIAEYLPHARSQLRAHAGLIDQQLSDGRNFLGGNQASMADIHLFSVPWFARASMPEVNELLSEFKHLPAWEDRVSAIGEGTRIPIDTREAHKIASATCSPTRPDIDPGDAQRLKPGMLVRIEPDDSKRGCVEGKVIIARSNEIAIQHENDIVGEVVVHFPRLGYRITRRS